MIRPRLKVIIPQIMVFAALVAPGSARAAAERTDGQIELDVIHALDASAPLKNDLITAATIQGEVTLSGTVSSEGSKELAESIVKGVAGVSGVKNNLKVGNPQQAEQDAGLGQEEAEGADVTVGMNDTPQAPPPQGPLPQLSQPQPAARPQYAPPAYGQQQGPQYGQQANAYPQQPVYQKPTGPVTIAAGTLLQVRTSEAVDSKRATDGTPVQFTVIQDVTSGGALAIPRGAVVHGVVTSAKQTQRGDLGGSSELALTLTSLDLGGKTYPVLSDEFRVQGPSKTGQTVGNAVTAGLIGTVIGCMAGRGVGCAIGAGAGVAAGTAASAASNGPRAWIPSEARVDFHLSQPLTVEPVSAQEASRLAQGLYQGGPTLYQREPRMYARPMLGYPAYGYPMYPYSPVYYRPYFMMGGAYYWR